MQMIRSGQPVVVFDAADDFRSKVTTRKTMSFQGDILSILEVNFTATMFWCSIWHQRKMLLKIFILQK